MPTNKSLGIAALVTATAAASAIALYVLTRPPVKSKEVKEAPLPKSKPFSKELTSEELCNLLREITAGVQQIIMSLAQEEQSLMKNPEAQKMSPENLQRYLLQRFQEGVAIVEAKVYKKHKVDENQVRQATSKYETEENVKKAVQELKSVYGAVMGGGAGDLPPVPDFLTKEKTLEVLASTMEILRQEAKESIKVLSEQGIEREKDEQKFQLEFQKIYGSRVEKERKALYKDNNIHDDLLIQAAVVKYQGDLTFQQKLRESSEAHNAEMAKMGFHPPGAAPSR